MSTLLQPALIDKVPTPLHRHVDIRINRPHDVQIIFETCVCVVNRCGVCSQVTLHGNLNFLAFAAAGAHLQSLCRSGFEQI